MTSNNEGIHIHFNYDVRLYKCKECPYFKIGCERFYQDHDPYLYRIFCKNEKLCNVLESRLRRIINEERTEKDET